eukprot:tig00020556_g10978.t1
MVLHNEEELQYVYSRQRRLFGRAAKFHDRPAEIMESIEPAPRLAEDFLERQVATIDVVCYPAQSEHECNTEIQEYTSSGMLHKEGGWPKEVDATEMDQCIRFRKRVEKDEDYIRTIVGLGDALDHALKQNLAVDVYQEYFEGLKDGITSEAPSAKTLMVFRDPSPYKRSVSSVSWYADGPRRLAVSYAVLEFQRAPEGMSPSSYIWDVTNPNVPELELAPASPLCCLEYSPRDFHLLVGGSYNGLVAFWDARRGSAPVETSPIEKSHRDPVMDVAWLQSKTGTEFSSLSTDGLVFWWDTRKLGEPTESLPLDVKGDGVVLGGTALQYDAIGGPTKFSVGTEQGLILSCNRKSKNPSDRVGTVYSGHHGPVYALERHPFFPKYFISIGDWAARIWNEDLRTPIMTTKYHNSYLTDGSWSPTRPGVFVTARSDGIVDVWDFFFKQNDPTLSLQVSDERLVSLRLHERGKLLAAGDAEGTTYLLELCESMHEASSTEKASMAAMFERESKREKNLEIRARELKARGARKAPEYRFDGKGREVQEMIADAEREFFSYDPAPPPGPAPGSGPAAPPSRSSPSVSPAPSHSTLPPSASPIPPAASPIPPAPSPPLRPVPPPGQRPQSAASVRRPGSAGGRRLSASSAASGPPPPPNGRQAWGAADDSDGEGYEQV